MTKADDGCMENNTKYLLDNRKNLAEISESNNSGIYSHIRNVFQKLKRRDNLTTWFFYVFCNTLFNSITSSSLFDAYLSLIAKQRGAVNYNTWVGFAESISGIFNLLLSIPIGLLADRYDRISLAHFTGYLGITASLISFYVFLTNNVTILYLNLCLWGLITTLQTTILQAVFVDSVPPKLLLEKYTQTSMLVTKASVIGPSISFCMFTFLSNKWTLEEVRVPLIAGCFFGPLAFSFLLNFHQPTIESSMASVVSTSSISTIGTLETPKHITEPGELDDINDPEAVYVHFEDTEKQLSTSLVQNSEKNMESSDLRQRCKKYVPYIICTSDFFIAIGAGMTVRFFSLFFINDYNMSPRALCTLSIVLMLSLSMTYKWTQKLAEIIGKAQAFILYVFTGITLLYYMTIVQSFTILLVVFILRALFQNAVLPINRSILFDHILPEDRGKWSAINCFNSGIWSLSALLGGILADTNDYRFTFHITAIVYTIGGILYLPLLWLVPRK